MVDAGEFGKQIAAMVRAEAAKSVAPLIAENAALTQRVAELVTRVDAMPAPQKGERGDAGEAGRDGANGASGEKGERGADGERGSPGEVGPQGPQGERGEQGLPGQDGAAGRDGKDGERGADGKSLTIDDIAPTIELAVTRATLEFERRASDTLQRAIDRIPVPKDGAPGRDGADGLGFDDMTLEFDGERAVTLKFTRGDVVKSFEFELPAVIDRGVFQDSAPYAKCDGVTFGGSWWIARKDLPEGRPGTSPDWRLAVKKGRDGKDGRDGIDKTAPVKLP